MPAEPWSLTSLRDKRIKIGAKVTFQMAEAQCRDRRSRKCGRLLLGYEHHSRRRDGRAGQMRQATTAEVRLDAGHNPAFNASASQLAFRRAPGHAVYDLPLPNTREGAILVPQPPGIRGMSAKR
jgi:hypothetical protein